MDYVKTLGQAINLQKSLLVFSKNIGDITRQNICNVLGVAESDGYQKYLGLPCVMGRKNKEVFQYLKERVWIKIQRWNHRYLSRAGEEALLKAVAQSIPNYAM